jgi:hypothetical protein
MKSYIGTAIVAAPLLLSFGCAAGLVGGKALDIADESCKRNPERTECQAIEDVKGRADDAMRDPSGAAKSALDAAGDMKDKAVDKTKQGYEFLKEKVMGNDGPE